MQTPELTSNDHDAIIRQIYFFFLYRAVTSYFTVVDILGGHRYPSLFMIPDRTVAGHYTAKPCCQSNFQPTPPDPTAYGIGI